MYQYQSKRKFSGRYLPLMLIPLSLLLVSCSISAPVPSPPLQSKGDHQMQDCPQRRPEICAQIYQPVCGIIMRNLDCKDNEPCPESVAKHKKTYSNACTACSDPAIKMYSEGACEER